MEATADFSPVLDGVKRTVRAELPPGPMEVAGWELTRNAAASSPPMATGGFPYSCNPAWPRFSIVKVSSLGMPTVVLPISRLPPGGMLSEPCFKRISGARAPLRR